MKLGKNTALITVFSMSLIASAQAGNMGNGSKDMPMNMGGMKDMPMDMGKSDQHKTGGTHKTQGVVKAVNKEKGTVKLAHDPVKSLNWPAMTMTFSVRDQMLFNKLAEGNEVKFEFVKEGKKYVVTSVKN